MARGRIAVVGSVAQVGGNLKVASFNVLNYFTTLVSEDSNARGADTAEERERQGKKIWSAMKAIDADVIKTYVELGMGVGIVAEMAYAPDPCSSLVKLPNSHLLFSPCVTKVGVQKGALLRTYAYKFIEMFAPHLTEAELRGLKKRGAPILQAPAETKGASVVPFSSRSELTALRGSARAI